MINLKMNRNKINLVIDGLMFIVLAAIAGIGFLIKYVLLPGYKINEKYDVNTDLLFLGLDRHQWGSIHLYLAFFMLFLLALHIILHWNSIICIFRQLIPENNSRKITGIATVITGFILALTPFVIKPEVVSHKRSYMHNRAPERQGNGNTETVVGAFPEVDKIIQEKAGSQISTPEDGNDASGTETKPSPQSSDSKNHRGFHNHNEDVFIDGTMTLSEISARYNLSVEELAGAIKIPPQYSNERLGRLRKRFGFEMDDLRSYVAQKTSKR